MNAGYPLFCPEVKSASTRLFIFRMSTCSVTHLIKTVFIRDVNVINKIDPHQNASIKSFLPSLQNKKYKIE